MKIPREKLPQIPRNIAQILFGKDGGRRKLLDVAGKPSAAKLYKRLVVLIHQNAVLCAKDSKLVHGRPDLRRKRKVSRNAVLFGDDDAQLVDQFGFAKLAENGAREPVCDDRG